MSLPLADAVVIAGLRMGATQGRTRGFLGALTRRITGHMLRGRIVQLTFSGLLLFHCIGSNVEGNAGNEATIEKNEESGKPSSVVSLEPTTVSAPEDKTLYGKLGGTDVLGIPPDSSCEQAQKAVDVDTASANPQPPVDRRTEADTSRSAKKSSDPKEADGKRTAVQPSARNTVKQQAADDQRTTTGAKEKHKKRRRTEESDGDGDAGAEDEPALAHPKMWRGFSTAVKRRQLPETYSTENRVGEEQTGAVQSTHAAYSAASQAMHQPPVWGRPTHRFLLPLSRITSESDPGGKVLNINPAVNPFLGKFLADEIPGPPGVPGLQKDPFLNRPDNGPRSLLPLLESVDDNFRSEKASERAFRLPTHKLWATGKTSARTKLRKHLEGLEKRSRGGQARRRPDGKGETATLLWDLSAILLGAFLGAAIGNYMAGRDGRQAEVRSPRVLTAGLVITRTRHSAKAVVGGSTQRSDA